MRMRMRMRIRMYMCAYTIILGADELTCSYARENEAMAKARLVSSRVEFSIGGIIKRVFFSGCMHDMDHSMYLPLLEGREGDVGF